MIEWAERNDGSIFVTLTGVLLACHWLGWTPGQAAILAALAFGVALLGLPHGSLDLPVAQRLMRTRAVSATILFAAVYGAVAVAYGLVWWWSAPIGLASFLLISAVHFGSDWHDRRSWIARLAYGLSVVSLPAMRHGAEVAAIYASLGVEQAAANQLVSTSQVVAVAALLVAFVAAARSPRGRDLFEIVAILVAALVLPPLMYFGLYFCWLHSPRHLLRTARVLELRTPMSILRNAALGTVAPPAVAFFLFEHRRSASVSQELTRLIFIGLAALTVPHMLLHGIEGSIQNTRGRKSRAKTPATDPSNDQTIRGGTMNQPLVPMEVNPSDISAAHTSTLNFPAGPRKTWTYARPMPASCSSSKPLPATA